MESEFGVHRSRTFIRQPWGDSDTTRSWSRVSPVVTEITARRSAGSRVLSVWLKQFWLAKNISFILYIYSFSPTCVLGLCNFKHAIAVIMLHVNVRHRRWEKSSSSLGLWRRRVCSFTAAFLTAAWSDVRNKPPGAVGCKPASSVHVHKAWPWLFVGKYKGESLEANKLHAEDLRGRLMWKDKITRGHLNSHVFACSLCLTQHPLNSQVKLLEWINLGDHSLLPVSR